MSNVISLEQLKDKIGGRAVVLAEVLPAQYYDAGHLPGAVHLPLDAIENGRLAEILPAKDRDVVLYCASATCQNSHIAARELASLGYTSLSVFGGGKAAWSEAGEPLEKAAGSAAPASATATS
jgi:rhodanese-related sulfurtransferase